MADRLPSTDERAPASQSPAEAADAFRRIDALCEKSRKLDRERLMGRAAIRHRASIDAALALAQQSAAVDEADVYPAPRNRREAEALARLALAHLDLIRAHIDAAATRCETDVAAHPEPVEICCHPK